MKARQWQQAKHTGQQTDAECSNMWAEGAALKWERIDILFLANTRKTKAILPRASPYFSSHGR